MDKKQSGYKEKPACAELYKAFPEFMTCPKCGADVEIWTDEDETICKFCGYKIFRTNMLTN